MPALLMYYYYLGFAQHTPALCSTHCSSDNVILPNPRTLDEYTPYQYWSANFIYLALT